MTTHFYVGQKISNFCNGFFGRDDYEPKTCVLVTPMFAVFVYDDGSATVLNASENLEQLITKHGFENWSYDNE